LEPVRKYQKVEDPATFFNFQKKIDIPKQKIKKTSQERVDYIVREE